MQQKLLSQIPKVSVILEKDKAKALIDSFSHQAVVDKIRDVLSNLRQQLLAEQKVEEKDLAIAEILAKVEKDLELENNYALTAVVNGTGVVVHTNLGRSLLSDSAQKSVIEVAENYSTLEIDTVSGQRGSRYNNVQSIIKELTGAKDCLVVNNNAAAVMLTLATFAKGKEVIIARGQLVEIGGSFRIPDVMERSGAKLVEVGSTNKVHLSDYKAAISEDTALIMKVHTSNYRIVGFSKEVPGNQLKELAADYDIPVVEDLGSGTLVDLRDCGLSHEPTVKEVVDENIDVITFSGDKLLGGPQAGIIVGDKEYIDKMKQNPLTRAIRVDKFTLAALEATLKQYRDLKQAKKEIPTLKMITDKPEEIKKRAESLLEELKSLDLNDLEFNLKEATSQVGGGSFPGDELPTFVVTINSQSLSCEELARKLRLNKVPIFSRIADEKVILDLRTIREKDFGPILSAIDNLRLTIDD